MRQKQQMMLHLDGLPESVLVDDEQIRALTISRLLRVDDVSSHLFHTEDYHFIITVFIKKKCKNQIEMTSHFTGSLFSSPAKVESFCHVDVVHGAVEGAGVEDLALDQGGALDDDVEVDDEVEVGGLDDLGDEIA